MRSRGKGFGRSEEQKFWVTEIWFWRIWSFAVVTALGVSGLGWLAFKVENVTWEMADVWTMRGVRVVSCEVRIKAST